VPAGEPVTFVVQAAGGQLGYQWYRDDVPIAGGNASSYTLAATGIADTGARFRVIVSNAAGAVSSNSAFLVVSSVGVGTPTTILTQPSGVAVTAGQPATFSVAAAGESLGYQWQRNGADIPGATDSSYTLGAPAMVDHGAEFRVVVSGAGGIVTSDAAVLIVNPGGAPTAVILSPAVGKLYRAGQAIKFKGTATDPQEKKLPASAFSWRVDFHHASQVDPVLPETPGKKAGSFRVPHEGDTSTDVWYRIQLTVTDSTGLSSTTFRDVRPQTATVTVNASSPGLSFTLDGSPLPAPQSFEAVVGMKRTLAAAASQVVDGVTYTFRKWSKGKRPEFSFVVPPRDQTLELTYLA
jgi:hypothetical protein